MGLDKDNLYNDIRTLVDSSSKESFKFAMETPYVQGQPSEHILRMSIRFGNKMTESISEKLADIIDRYVRAAFAIYENSGKGYNDRNNPIRDNIIFSNTNDGGIGSNKGDNRPSIYLSNDILHYIKRDEV